MTLDHVNELLLPLNESITFRQTAEKSVLFMKNHSFSGNVDWLEQGHGKDSIVLPIMFVSVTTTSLQPRVRTILGRTVGVQNI